MSSLNLNCRFLVRAGLVVMAGIMDFKITFLTSTQSRFQILNFKLGFFSDCFTPCQTRLIV